jgi:hypothetical protein
VASGFVLVGHSEFNSRESGTVFEVSDTDVSPVELHDGMVGLSLVATNYASSIFNIDCANPINSSGCPSSGLPNVAI